MPIAAVIKGQTYAIHSDHLNTPRKLTQADGQAAWQWEYSAFGDEPPSTAAKRFTSETTTPTMGSTSVPEVTFNLRYPGQYFDAETKLHYNYFRSYDSRTGRYTQGDPIGLDGGWNRFGYVDGNTLEWVDPKGLVKWSGTVTSAGFINGYGSAAFLFDLTSGCKCGKKVRIRGYASAVAGGLGVKYAATSAPGNFEEPWECPDSSKANGFFTAYSAAIVTGGGASWCVMSIGKLKSGKASLTTGVAGFDISAGVFFGASVVVDEEIIDCETCGVR